MSIFNGVDRTPLPPVCCLSGWASHFVAKAATPKPIGRRRAALHASYGPAGHPAIISGKTAARPTRFSLPTKISKTTPCKVTGGSLAWMLYPRKHFDTSRLGKNSLASRTRRRRFSFTLALGQRQNLLRNSRRRQAKKFYGLGEQTNSCPASSGKSAAPFHHRTICKTADGAAHRPRLLLLKRE